MPGRCHVGAGELGHFRTLFWLLVLLTQNPTNCHWVLIQKFHVSHGGWHGEFGTIMPFMVTNGCKMLHNSSFDSMSHFVQDEFQSTNSEDNFKHIRYMSKKHTHTKNISSTHVKHIENIQNIKSKQNHMFKLYIDSQVWICYTDTYSGTQQNKTPLWIPCTVACSKALNVAVACSQN